MMVNNDDEPSKEELQEELRARDLPVSGTKDELRQRLRDSSGRGQQAGDDDPARAQGSGDAPAEARGNGRRPGEVAQLAARQLASLTRHRVEGVAGFGRDDDGWRVDVEVVEVSRVPSSTDVLGLYTVWVDRDGELLGYERAARYVRGQAGGQEG